MDLDDAVEAQLGLSPSDAVSEVLAYLPAPQNLPAVLAATPEERYELARAREVLYKVEQAVRDRRKAIDLAFLRAAQEKKLDQVKLSSGSVRIKKPAATYETHGDEMRRQLLALAESQQNVTQEEIDEALALIISVKPNHTKLNYLARHRGEDVEAVIEANRTKQEPDPTRYRPEYHLEGGVK